jgi:hypothetical protein
LHLDKQVVDVAITDRVIATRVEVILKDKAFINLRLLWGILTGYPKFESNTIYKVRNH